MFLYIPLLLLISCDDWRNDRIKKLIKNNIQTIGSHPANNVKMKRQKLTCESFQYTVVDHESFSIKIPWQGVVRKRKKKDCLSLKLNSGKKIVILESVGLGGSVKEVVSISTGMKGETGDISNFEALQITLDSTVNDMKKESSVSGVTAEACMVILKQGIMKKDMFPAKLLQTKSLNVIQFGNLRKSPRIQLEVIDFKDRELTIAVSNENYDLRQEEIDFIIRSIEFK